MTASNTQTHLCHLKESILWFAHVSGTPEDERDAEAFVAFVDSLKPKVEPDAASEKQRKKAVRERRARRKEIVKTLPTAAAFLTDVAEMMRRYSKTDSAEDRNERHIADTLDAFVEELLEGRRPAFPAPAQEPQQHAKAS